MANKFLLKDAENELLDDLQKRTFSYFLTYVSEHTGLIADTNKPGSPASIAVTGFGLGCYIAGIHRDLITRQEAAMRTQKILSFFYHAPQSNQPVSTGYKGFYYHFLDMHTGLRAGNCELSTIDTAILICGILAARNYFTQENAIEDDIRQMADVIYNRVNWQWALNKKESFVHGWKPKQGFLKYRWNSGYSEAHILYILAIGSDSFPVDASCYTNWAAGFEWVKIYEAEQFYAGPLFIHQSSQVWLHLHEIYDKQNRYRQTDYFTNSAVATNMQQKYAIHNPKNFNGYGKHIWGFTACDGPGPKRKMYNNRRQVFYDYKARAAPFGPDDGTICPWAMITSLPFAPELVLDCLMQKNTAHPSLPKYFQNLESSYNLSFLTNEKQTWISLKQFGLNLGPAMIMIENYRSGLLWDIMKKSHIVINGLKRSGFTGGYLSQETNEV